MPDFIALGRDITAMIVKKYAHHIVATAEVILTAILSLSFRIEFMSENIADLPGKTGI